MRRISSESVYEAVKKLWVEIAFKLPDDVKNRIEAAMREETSPGAREILAQILENAALAEKEKIPLCQDTGFPSVFIGRGQDVVIEGENLHRSIDRAVLEGTREGYLRASVAGDPFSRENTCGNIPAVVYSETIPGDEFRVSVSAKGAGSENSSCLAMLKPGEGMQAVKKRVSEHVSKFAANSCPPLVVGVGIGGTADKAMLMAKKACLRNLDIDNRREADFEEELLSEINSSGIGPGGFGGDTTALAVNVDTFACHIASLPVAVNINCHAVRRKEILLS